MGKEDTKTGRPAVELTEQQIEQVGKLAAVLNTSQIADYLGISHVTFKAIRDRDERVSFVYNKGKAKAIAQVAKNLVNKALDGDTASMTFYLKTQAGWKETQHIQQENKEVKTFSDMYED